MVFFYAWVYYYGLILEYFNQIVKCSDQKLHLDSFPIYSSLDSIKLTSNKLKKYLLRIWKFGIIKDDKTIDQMLD